MRLSFGLKLILIFLWIPVEPLGREHNAWGMEGNHMVEEIEPVYYGLDLPQQDVEKRLIWTTRSKDKRAPFRDSFPTFKDSSSLQDRVSLTGRYGKRGSKYRSRILGPEKMALKYFPILFA